MSFKEADVFGGAMVMLVVKILKEVLVLKKVSRHLVVFVHQVAT